jgi:Response regulator containing CheY-like receiver, AAA-type ATPase, and DNA-binding domains
MMMDESRRLTILIVDDDEFFLDALQNSVYLRAQNVDVETARSGDEALKLIGKGHYDGVYTDIYMPGLDGYAVLSAIRQTRPALPVIFISGDERQAERAIAAGASAFLAKPIDRQQFVQVLRQLVQG